MRVSDFHPHARGMRSGFWTLCGLLCLSLSGCGLKGGLFLPPGQTPVSATVPAPTPEPASPSPAPSGTSPSSSPNPAPPQTSP
ncbi:lipoprotein [Ferrovum sp.]|uniref:lipoprotein n=1 Tax=Ferrovum sp. TaxID=2609467 RepID=UPI0034553607